MVPHDTPPRCTVLGVHQRKRKDICFYARREVRRRTLFNIPFAWPGQLLCPFRSCKALENAVCLLDSEDELDQLLIVLLPVIFLLVFFLCLPVLQRLFILLLLTKALFFL